MGPVEAVAALLAIGTPAVIVLRHTAEPKPPKPPKAPKPAKVPKVKEPKAERPTEPRPAQGRTEPPAPPRQASRRDPVPARREAVPMPSGPPVTENVPASAPVRVAYAPAPAEQAQADASILSGLASVEPDVVTPLRRAASAALLLGLTLLASGAVGVAIFRVVSALK